MFNNYLNFPNVNWGFANGYTNCGIFWIRMHSVVVWVILMFSCSFFVGEIFFAVTCFNDNWLGFVIFVGSFLFLAQIVDILVRLCCHFHKCGGQSVEFYLVHRHLNRIWLFLLNFIFKFIKSKMPTYLFWIKFFKWEEPL